MLSIAPSYTKPAYTYQRAGYMFYNVSYATNISLVDPFRPELGKATLGQLATRFSQNLIEMPVSLGEAVSAKRDLLGRLDASYPGGSLWAKMIPRWLFYFPLILMGGLIIAGIVLLAIEREIVIPAYILAALVSICLTPWPEQFFRYWAPVSSFLDSGASHVPPGNLEVLSDRYAPMGEVVCTDDPYGSGYIDFDF